MLKLGLSHYKYSLGIRGDNTPERAAYLGYLDAKKLYPDVDSTTFKAFIQGELERYRTGRVVV